VAVRHRQIGRRGGRNIIQEPEDDLQRQKPSRCKAAFGYRGRSTPSAFDPPACEWPAEALHPRPCGIVRAAFFVFQPLNEVGTGDAQRVCDCLHR
jgi:hypothetical protein